MSGENDENDENRDKENANPNRQRTKEISPTRDLSNAPRHQRDIKNALQAALSGLTPEQIAKLTSEKEKDAQNRTQFELKIKNMAQSVGENLEKIGEFMDNGNFSEAEKLITSTENSLKNIEDILTKSGYKTELIQELKSYASDMKSLINEAKTEITKQVEKKAEKEVAKVDTSTPSPAPDATAPMSSSGPHQEKLIPNEANDLVGSIRKTIEAIRGGATSPVDQDEDKDKDEDYDSALQSIAAELEKSIEERYGPKQLDALKQRKEAQNRSSAPQPPSPEPAEAAKVDAPSPSEAADPTPASLLTRSSPPIKPRPAVFTPISTTTPPSAPQAGPPPLPNRPTAKTDPTISQIAEASSSTLNDTDIAKELDTESLYRMINIFHMFMNTKNYTEANKLIKHIDLSMSKIDEFISSHPEYNSDYIDNLKSYIGDLKPWLENEKETINAQTAPEPEPAPTPSPAPSPTVSPAPSPTVSPAPSPTVSPAPAPTVSPAPAASPPATPPRSHPPVTTSLSVSTPNDPAAPTTSDKKYVGFVFKPSSAPGRQSLNSITTTSGNSLSSLKNYLDEQSNRTACGVTAYRECNVPWGTTKTGIEIDLKSDASKPVNKIYAYENDDKDLTIAIKKGLSDDDKEQAIISSCKMAVESAYHAMLDPTKPKVVFNLSNTSTDNRELVYDQLTQSIKELKAKATREGKTLTDMKIPEITGYRPAPKPLVP